MSVLSIQPPQLPTAQFASATYSTTDIAGPSIGITVSVTPTPTQTVSVNYATVTGGSAVLGTDYNNASGTLTFLRGQASASFTVPILWDAGSTFMKTVNLQLSAPSGVTLNPQGTTATLDIQPAVLPTVQFSATTYSTPDVAGPSTAITVTCTPPPTGPMSVGYFTMSGTAMLGIDYNAASGTLNFAANQASATFTVPILYDAASTSMKTVSLQLTNPQGANLNPMGFSATLDIQPPPPTVQFASATYTTADTAGPSTAITVTVTPPSPQACSVGYTTTVGGSAVAGTDYSFNFGLLNFAANQSSATFTVPILYNSGNTSGRTVNLLLNYPNGVTLNPSGSTATLTIQATLPIVQFATATYTTADAAGPSTAVTVTVAPTPTQTVSVNYATVAGGTAVAGTDYSSTGGTLTFAANQSSATFTVPILYDVNSTVAKSVDLQLSAPNGVILNPAGANAVLNIQAVALPTVGFSGLTYSTPDAAGPSTLIGVFLSAQSAQPVTVNYATVSGGTAVAGTDYTNTNSSVTIPAYALSASFTLPILFNGASTSVHSVNLQLSSPVGATLNPGSTNAVLNIQPPTLPSVGFSSFNYFTPDANAPPGPATPITVLLSAAFAQPVSVNYATVPGGTAVDPTDYHSVAGTLNFPAYTTSATFTVPIVYDGAATNWNTIDLQLSQPKNATLSPPNSTATLLIQPIPTVYFSSAGYSAFDNNPNAPITVLLSAASSQTVTVAYSTSNGTATAGTDYTTTSGTLTFTPGQTQQQLNVPLMDDGLVDGNQTINLTLSSPMYAALGAAGSSYPSTAIVTMQEPLNRLPTVSITQGTNQAYEGDTLYYTLSLSAPIPSNVDVPLSYYNGTASYGSDFTGPTMVTIPANTTSTTFSLQTNVDNEGNYSETVVPTLGTPTNAIVGTPSSWTTVVFEDPILTIGPPTVEGPEGQDLYLTATLSVPSQETLTVPLILGGTAVMGEDYEIEQDVIIPEGQTSATIDISTNVDHDSCPNHTVIVTLGNATDVVIGTPSSATAIIDEPQPTGTPTVYFDVTPILGPAGTQMAFIIDLSAATDHDVTVQLGYAGNAVSAVDYAPLPTSATIPAGSTTVTIPITSYVNPNDEGDRQIIASMTNPTGAVLGLDSVHMAIVQDPHPAIAPVITQVSPATTTLPTDPTNHYTNQQNLILYGTGESSSMVRVYWDNDPTGTVFNVPVTTLGTWKVDLRGITLPEGVYVFHAVTLLADQVTPSNKASLPFTVTVDLTPPTVLITPTVSVVSAPEIQFTVTVDDNFVRPADGTPYYYWIDTPPASLPYGTFLNGRGIATAYGGSTLSSGFHTLFVKTSDAAGNSATAQLVFTYVQSSVFGDAQVQARLVDQAHDSVGTLQLSEPLDLDSSPGQSTQAMNASLVYSSASVDVRPAFQLMIQTPQDIRQLGSNSNVSVQIQRVGSAAMTISESVPMSSFNPGEILTITLQRSGDVVPGLYSWTWSVYTDSTLRAGGWPLGMASRLFYIQPLDSSPFGPGWMLSPLDYLVPLNNVGGFTGVARILADGTALLYNQVASAAYASPVGDFGTLTGSPTTGWIYTLKSGESRYYDKAGHLTKWINSDGTQVVTFSNYANTTVGSSPTPQLITAADGTVTTLSYAGGECRSLNTTLVSEDKSASIQRLTQLHYDAYFRLDKITRPDASVRSFLFDPNFEYKVTSDTVAASAKVAPAIPWLTLPAFVYQNTWTYDAAFGYLATYTPGGGTNKPFYYTPIAAQGITNGRISRPVLVGFPYSQQTDPNGQSSYVTLLLGMSFMQPSQYRLTPQLIASPTCRVLEILKADSSFEWQAYDGNGDLAADYIPGRYTTYTYQFNYPATTTVTDIGVNGAVHTKQQSTTYASVVGNYRIATQTDFDGNVTKYDYYSSGLLRDVITAGNAITTYAYFTSGPYSGLLKEVDTWDPESLVTLRTLMSYDVTPANGAPYPDPLRRLHTITYPDGTTQYSDYDIYGEVCLTVDRVGWQTMAAHDIMGRTTLQTDVLGAETLYAYDAGGMLRFTYAMGGILSINEYNAARQLVRQSVTTEALNNLAGMPGDGSLPIPANTLWLPQVTTYALDPAGNVVRSVNPRGVITLFAYDPANRVIVETDAAGTREQRSLRSIYLTSGRMAASIDGNGNITRTLYDDIAVTVTTIEAFGTPVQRQTVNSYDNMALLILSRNPLGVNTRYGYDSAYNQDLVAIADNVASMREQATKEFDAYGRVVQAVDIRGNETNTTYDDVHDTVTTTVNTGTNLNPETTVTTHDSVGRTVAVSNPDGTAVYTSYLDSLRRVDTISTNTDGTLRTTSQVSDFQGRTVLSVDATGLVTQYFYDDRDRRVYQDQGAGRADDRVSVTAYDLLAQTALVVDALRNYTGTVLDPLNRRMVEATFYGLRIYQFDSADNLRLAIDRDNRRIQYLYDQLNRPVLERWLTQSYASQRDITYLYYNGTIGTNNVNQLNTIDSVAQVTDPDAGYQMLYDERGDMWLDTSQTTAGNPNMPTVAEHYAINGGLPNGRKGDLLTANIHGSVTIPEGNVTLFWTTYDGQGRITAVGESGNSNPAQPSFEADYQYFASQHHTLTTDWLGALKTGQIADTTLDTFDPNPGELTQIQHTSGTGVVIAQFGLAYDHAGRIIGITTIQAGVGIDVATYGYNAYSELQSASDPALPTESYQYDVDSDRQGAGQIIIADNRLAADANYLYAYDPEGNVIQRTSVATGAVTSYQWDYRNRLIQVIIKDVSGNQLSQINYRYDAMDRLIERNVQVAGQTPVIQRYIYNGSQVLFVFDGNNQLQQRLLYGAQTDQLVAEEVIQGNSGHVYWALGDQVGSVRALIDSNGNVVNRLRYDSFGNIVQLTNPALLPLSTYTGRQWDPAIGMYQFRARWYDPGSARFISEDSAGFVDGYNLYRYTDNTPLNNIDPSGHEPITITLLVAGVILAAAYTGAAVYDATGNAGMAVAAAIGAGALIFAGPAAAAAFGSSATMALVAGLPAAGSAIGSAAGEAIPWFLSGGNPDPTAVAIGSMVGGIAGGLGGGVLQAFSGTCVTRLAGIKAAAFIAGTEIAGAGIGAGVAALEGGDPLMGAQVGMLAGAFGGGLVASRFLKSCFAARTQMRTPTGWKAIEEFRVGDLILSRSEDNPDGAIEAKQVEEVFVHTAPIMHLHIGGQVIRTTAEHAFFSYGNGWVPASALRIGDVLVGMEGQLTSVEDLCYSGDLDTVYNLRVQDCHTYFVGSSEWAFSVWAHNSDCGVELGNGMRDRGRRLGQQQGREFRTDQLALMEFDPNTPRSVRGWLRNERRLIEQGRITEPRTPPGYVMAHGRTTPAREGFDYSNSRLQGADLNILEESIRRRQGIP